MLPNNLNPFDFSGRFQTKWFFGITEVQMPVSHEDRYRKFGRPLFQRHRLVYISELSFPETPKR